LMAQKKLLIMMGKGYQPRDTDKRHLFPEGHSNRAFFTRQLNSSTLYIVPRFGENDNLAPDEVHPSQTLVYMHEVGGITKMLTTHECMLIPPKANSENNEALKLGDLVLVDHTLELVSRNIDGIDVDYRTSPARPAIREGEETKRRSHGLSILLRGTALEQNIGLRAGNIVMGGAASYKGDLAISDLQYFQQNGAHLLTGLGLTEFAIARHLGLEQTIVAVAVEFASLNENVGLPLKWVAPESLEIAAKMSRTAEGLLVYTAEAWAGLIGDREHK